MFYDIKTNLAAESLYVDSYTEEGKALEMFINLQTALSLKELEKGLCSVLTGQEENFELIDEHTQIFANKDTAVVKNYYVPETTEPETGEYSTLKVYELICRFNILFDNQKQIWAGAKEVPDFTEELKKKMDLVSPSEGVKTV